MKRAPPGQCLTRRLFFQAASALHQTFRKFPALYNSSMVASFEPKVIYKVTDAGQNLTFWIVLSSPMRSCPPDASDGPRHGHRPQTPTLEAEPLQRRHSSDPVQLGPDVDSGSGRPAGLGPPPPPVEAVRRVGPVCPEGLRLTVGGLKSHNHRELRRVPR